MDILRVNMIQLTWNAGLVRARLGLERDNPAGFGGTLPDALRDLANLIEISPRKMWVPRPAKVYIEGGVQKFDCPECGAVHTSDFEKVLAFVCNRCGAGVDVEE